MNSGTSVTWQGLEPVVASTVPTPASGHIIFVDIADGLLKAKDSAGDVVLLVVTNTSGVIVGPVTMRTLTETALNLITLLDGEIAIASDTGSLRIGDGVTAGGNPANMASQYTILCPPIGTPTENGASVIAAYAEAKTRTPNGSALAADNRVLIQGGYGDYDLGTNFAQDADFIDFAWPGSCVRDAVNGNHQTPGGKITLTGTWNISCQDSKVSGVELDTGYFTCTDATNYSDTVIIQHANASFFPESRFDGVIDNCLLQGSSLGTSYGTVQNSFADFSVMNNVQGTVENFYGVADVAGVSVASTAVMSNVIGGPTAFDGTIDSAAVLLDCATVSSGVYTYLSQNTKRKNDTYAPTETGKDLTSLHTITWTNPTPNAIKVESELVLSNLDTGVETFSVAVTSAAGSNTFTRTKAAGESTFTIAIPTYLGYVAIAGNYVITIISDNASQTNVSDTLNITVMAVL